MENIRMDLRLFDANTQVTTQQSLTEEMKTFYSDYLIDAAEPELVHDQFAQKHPIPANGGKTIQFRRFAPLGKALTALTEGVTPDGQSLSMSTVEAAVRQYGGYIQMSDLLLLTAIDNNLTMATKLLGAQAGRTLDTITREVLVGGDNVQYADESVSARYLLRGGNAGAADNNYLTVDCIRRAVRALKNANCRRIDGAFPVIIHPDVAYDLMNDPKWLAPHQYVDTEHMYEGEIGKIEGCRFVESTEAKIFHAEDLAADSRTLLANGAVSGKTTVAFDGGTVKPGALVGRQVLIGNACVTVKENTASSMTVDAPVTVEDNAILYPGEAGAQGRDVYATLVLGADGYGTTETVTACCLTPPHMFKEGSIGLPFPDTYIKIVEPDTDREVPYGQEGEILLAGPTVMKEYMNNPEETAQTLRTHADGLTWVYTGDLGVMDEQGFIYFRGRAKRMIISSGYNVYPSQIENILDAHEYVQMSCVIGVPDPYKMQKVKAFVKLAQGVPATEETKQVLMAYCRKNVAKYAMPYDIEFKEDMPKTLVGKVAYRQLEEEELAKIKAAEEK